MELMVDIETLDVGPRSVILSIGVLPFDEGGYYEGRQFLPSVREQLDVGRTISLTTIKFWSGQSQASVLEAMVGEEDRMPIEYTLTMLRGFIGSYPKANIWARGPMFDLGNIASLFDTFDEDVPWLYNSPRDLRTFLAEAQALGWAYPETDPGNVAHTALGDCREQVKQLMSARQYIDSMAYSALAYGMPAEAALSSGC